MSRHDIQLQAEQESDQIAEDFLDNKIESVEQFLEQFMVSNSSYSLPTFLAFSHAACSKRTGIGDFAGEAKIISLAQREEKQVWRDQKWTNTATEQPQQYGRRDLSWQDGTTSTKQHTKVVVMPKVFLAWLKQNGFKTIKGVLCEPKKPFKRPRQESCWVSQQGAIDLPFSQFNDPPSSMYLIARH